MGLFFPKYKMFELKNYRAVQCDEKSNEKEA